MTNTKRALISVSDKQGVSDFAKGLIRLGYEIISTGGTYELLKDQSVLNVSQVTNFPEIMDGRVKTLHPAIHGGILAARDNASHIATLEEHAIAPINLVAVNLYPFKETVKNSSSTEADIIENIDIGGPAMIRSAAKNHAFVTVITDPADYTKVLTELESGEISIETKKSLAAKAFRYTAAYDTLIAGYFSDISVPEFASEKLTLTYELKQTLRYGENPHQKAAFYAEPLAIGGIAAAHQLHGKELSYNNIADADMALELACEFDQPVAVAVKHQNPCGVGIGDDITSAYVRAYEADPVSIFGGIIALNRPVDAKCAELLKDIFLEIIIAPDFTQEALAILTKKKNLRLLRIDMTQGYSKRVISPINGGLLIQERDTLDFGDATLTFPTKRKPTQAELKTSKFGWTVMKYVKSNGILIARDNMTLGIGPGQTNRVGAAKIALVAAGDRAKGALLASDAFFPMPDTVEEAAKYGIEVIIQPGGSIKDEDSIKACDKHNIAMIFTGIRHFRH